MSSNPTIAISNNNVNLQPRDPTGTPLAGASNGCPSGSGQAVFNPKLFSLSFLVGLMDTFHDFAKGDRIPDEHKETLKEEAAKAAANLVCMPIGPLGNIEDGNGKVNAVIKYITKGQGGSVTGAYERNTVSYFEDQPAYQSVLGQFSTSTTFQSIVKEKEQAPEVNKDEGDDDGGEGGESKVRPSRRPALWKELCGDYIPADDPNRNNKIATGPALTDRRLHITWDPNDKYLDPNTIYTKDKGRQMRIIADFITKYFYPEEKGLDRGAFVFDMGAKSVGKIFSALPQISASINPLNISDSASTSLNHIKPSILDPTAERNDFNFITTEPLPPELEQYVSSQQFKVYLVQGNIFTWNCNINNTKYQTRFIYNLPKTANYDKNNCYNFNIKIVVSMERQGVTKTVTFDMVYNTAEYNGPSVPYLAALIYGLARLRNASNQQAATEAKNYLLTVTSGKAMVNITPLIVDAINQGIDPDFIIRLLFDIKRCGDWEQSRSAQLASTKPSTANTMFCTGDVLCSFFSRLTEGNCIWHYEGGDGAMGWVLTLFRSPNGQGVSPKVKQTLEIIRQSKTVELVLDRICHQRELQQSFATVKQLAQDALNSGARYQLTIDERGTGPFTLAMEALATQLCQLGMADIISKADEYIGLLSNGAQLIQTIVGEDVTPQDACGKVDPYVIGLNYLRDLYDSYNVTDDNKANNFINFMNASVKSNFGILSNIQGIPQAWKTLSQWPDWLVENTNVANFNQEQYFKAGQLINLVSSLINQIPTQQQEPQLQDIFFYMKIMLGFPPRLDTQNIALTWENYQSQILTFIAVGNWINKEAAKGAASLSQVITLYATTIGSINPIENQGKLLDLITQIPTFVKSNIDPGQGGQAVPRGSIVSKTNKKTKKAKILGYYLGLGGSITVPTLGKARQQDGTFVSIFNQNHRPCWGFKFGISSLLNLIKYLKSLRKNLMTRLSINGRSDYEWPQLVEVITQGRLHELNARDGIRDSELCNNRVSSHPSALLTSYPDVLKSISYDNQYLNDLLKHGIFGREFFDETFNCQTGQSKKPLLANVLQSYCTQLKSNTGLGVSSEIKAINIDRRETQKVKAVLIPQMRVIANWLVNLLSGESFNSNALTKTLKFTEAISKVQDKSIRELIVYSGYGDVPITASDNDFFTAWRNVMGQGQNIIQTAISGMHVSSTSASGMPHVVSAPSDVAMGGDMGGGYKEQRGGDRLSSDILLELSRRMNNMVYDLGGKSASLIDPLIGNMETVMRKQYSILQKIGDADLLTKLQPLIQELQHYETINGAVSPTGQAIGVRNMMFVDQNQKIYAHVISQDYVQAFFKSLFFYSLAVDKYRNGYNLDVMGFQSMLGELQDIFSNFMFSINDFDDDIDNISELPNNSGLDTLGIMLGSGEVISENYASIISFVGPANANNRNALMLYAFLNDNSLIKQLKETLFSVELTPVVDEQREAQYINQVTNQIIQQITGTNVRSINPNMKNEIKAKAPALRSLVEVAYGEIAASGPGNTDSEIINAVGNRVYQMLNTLLYVSSIRTAPKFILPSIKILIALTLRRFFYAKIEKKTELYASNKLLQIFFASANNLPNYPSGLPENWFRMNQNQTPSTTSILNTILYKLFVTEVGNSGFIRISGPLAAIMGGRKTRKKKHRKRFTLRKHKKRDGRKTRFAKKQKKHKKTRYSKHK